jgi:hypothetical protein
MIPANASGPEDFKEAKLPRRDWILLPLLSLLTICFIAGSTELSARWMFRSSKTSYLNCFITNDPKVGVRGIPNSICLDKFPEGKLEEYRLNSCGHRAGMECAPKPPGTYRIVMVGSSIAMGLGVSADESFAFRLPAKLSQRDGRRIELYNEGVIANGGTPHSLAARFDEVLAAKPDLILWILSPLDIRRSVTVAPIADDTGASRSLNLATRGWQRIKSSFATKLFEVKLPAFFARTQTAFLLQHFLYESQSQYVKSALMRDNDELGFLRVEQSTSWKKRMRLLNSDTTDIEAFARTAGVPLVVVLVPDRAPAAMISMGEWPAGYDPYKLDNELRSIIVSHGGIYLDILPSFRTIPNPEQYYFPVDGHPNAGGHAIIADLLAKALTNGSVPALRAASPTQPDHEKGN